MNLNNQKQLFLDSRLEPSQDVREYENDRNEFENIKHPKIPPIGIAEPKLVEKSLEYIEDPESLQQYIQDLEAYKQETPAETIKRESLSHSARGLEGLGGFWGDMQEFFSSLMGTPLQEPEIEDNEPQRKGGFRLPQEVGEGPTLFKTKMPTTQELREQSKESFGEYLEPKTSSTQATQEIAQDIGSMFAIPGNLSAIQKMLIPVYGQGAKQVTKGLGGSEKAQSLAKLGAMGFASLLNLGNAPGIARQAINEAEQMMPRGLSFNVQPTQQAFQRIRNSNWYRSGPTPAKRPAMAEIERIENQIRNNRLDGRMAMQLRRDLNDTRRNMGGFEVHTRPDRRQALAHLNEVDQALLASMENYGTRVNPTWWRQYNLANEAFRVTQRSRALSEFIHQHGGSKLISDTAKTLFPYVPLVSATALPGTTAIAGTALLGMKTIQVANRMIRSDLLRNHYANVLRQASTGNAKATTDAIKKFDAVANKLETQSKKSPIKKSPTM